MPNPGDLLIGRYRILDRLGSGGMATVHRARDERLEREVAIKVLLPSLAGDPNTAARFEREARSLAAAAHPGVVAIHDVDAGDAATGREPFFVMELCPGGSLADRLAEGRRMAPDHLVPILVQVADGLADLHRRDVVHRDVKPQNILLAADRAKVADFGVALSDDGIGSSELTMPGTAVGTLAYLAPEILGGQRATSATDVYGLGVVAFVALTGQPPRPAASLTELVAAAQTPARRVSDVAPELGTAFDDIVAAALAVRPGSRPDMLSVASGLTTALGRWARDGGRPRESPAPGVSDDPQGERTTALAIPLAATAAIRVEESARSAPAVQPPGGRRAGTGGSLVGAAAIIAVVLAAIAILATLNRGTPSSAVTTSAPPASAASVSPPPSPPAPSIAVASVRPSARPTADPALSALDAMSAAIAAARGGPDGLKGKEANDLETRVAAIRRALDSGDRASALEEARKLDGKIKDAVKGLARDSAARLRSASADLVRALGG